MSNYDKETITATVTAILDVASGEITVSTQTGTKDTFINTYSEEKSGSFEFGKHIEGRAFNGTDEFTFVISTSDTGAPMPTNATKVGDEYQIKLKPAANETDATAVVGNFVFKTADLRNSPR